MAKIVENDGRYFYLDDGGGRTEITKEQALTTDLGAAAQGVENAGDILGAGIQDLYGRAAEGLGFDEYGQGQREDAAARAQAANESQSFNDRFNPFSATIGNFAPAAIGGTAAAVATGGASIPVQILATGAFEATLAAANYAPTLADRAMAGGLAALVAPLGPIAPVGARALGIANRTATKIETLAARMQARTQATTARSRAPALDAVPSGGQVAGRPFQGSTAGAAANDFGLNEAFVDAGGKLTPTQLDGSRASRLLEQAQSGLPIVNTRLDNARAANQVTIANEVKGLYGLPEGKAGLRSRDIQAILGRSDEWYDNSIAKALDDGTEMVPPSLDIPNVDNLADSIVNDLNDILKSYRERFADIESMDAKAYNRERNKMMVEVRRLGSGKNADPELAGALRDVVESMDQQAETFGILDREWRRKADGMYPLTKILDTKATVIARSGDKGGINARTLTNELRKMQGTRRMEPGAGGKFDRLNILAQGMDANDDLIGNSGTVARAVGAATRKAAGLVGVGF